MHIRFFFILSFIPISKCLIKLCSIIRIYNSTLISNKLFIILFPPILARDMTMNGIDRHQHQYPQARQKLHQLAASFPVCSWREYSGFSPEAQAWALYAARRSCHAGIHAGIKENGSFFLFSLTKMKLFGTFFKRIGKICSYSSVGRAQPW